MHSRTKPLVMCPLYILKSYMHEKVQLLHVRVRDIWFRLDVLWRQSIEIACRFLLAVPIPVILGNNNVSFPLPKKEEKGQEKEE